MRVRVAVGPERAFVVTEHEGGGALVRLPGAVAPFASRHAAAGDVQARAPVGEAEHEVQHGDVRQGQQGQTVRQGQLAAADEVLRPVLWDVEDRVVDGVRVRKPQLGRGCDHTVPVHVHADQTQLVQGSGRRGCEGAKEDEGEGEGLERAGSTTSVVLVHGCSWKPAT